MIIIMHNLTALLTNRVDFVMGWLLSFIKFNNNNITIKQ